MIKEVDADLLEYPLDGFIHQANCFHTMGAGIALSIKQKYPEVYEADKAAGIRGDSNRLGSFSFAKTKDGKVGYNLYGQYNYGRQSRFTSYDAVCNGLIKICNHADSLGLKKLGLPKGMGCVLGGGSWRIVRAIIDDIFLESPIELYICNYQQNKL